MKVVVGGKGDFPIFFDTVGIHEFPGRPCRSGFHHPCSHFAPEHHHCPDGVIWMIDWDGVLGSVSPILRLAFLSDATVVSLFLGFPSPF